MALVNNHMFRRFPLQKATTIGCKCVHSSEARLQLGQNHRVRGFITGNLGKPVFIPDVHVLVTESNAKALSMFAVMTDFQFRTLDCPNLQFVFVPSSAPRISFHRKSSTFHLQNVQKASVAWREFEETALSCATSIGG